MFSSIINRRLSIFLASCLGVIGLSVAFAYTPDENNINFLDYPAGIDRKQAFINYLTPIIEENTHSLLNDRKKLLHLSQQQKLNIREQRWLRHISHQYGEEPFSANNDDWSRLLNKLDIIPTSLVLAQAAKESGWGTSRFARKGHNYFGQWCYKKGCGMVPENRSHNANHEVARYSSIEESIAAYVNNLNTHPAYKKLRTIRTQLRKTGQDITGHSLASGLQSYSQRGKVYVKEIQSLIRNNKLDTVLPPS